MRPLRQLFLRAGTTTERPEGGVAWKFFLQLTVVFLAYFVAGILGQATTNIRSGNIGPVWPAYGIALAALLAYGYRVWPAVSVSAFLVAVQGGIQPLGAAGQAAGATLAAASGTFLLRRIPDFDPSLPRLRDALGLIVLGAFGSALVSSSIGIASLHTTGTQSYSGWASAWLIYWLGDATGVLLVTPLVFTASQLFRIPSRAGLAALGALVTCLTATCFLIFGDLPLISVQLDFLAFAVLPLVMWGAIQFGIAGAALSVFLIAALATVLTALGSGPFSTHTPVVNAVLLDVLFAVFAVSGLSLAAVIAERVEAEALSRASRQLIETQERERARIARELHDDIGQRLAVLAIELTGRSNLETQASEIARDVQTLSRELHPSWIEALGIVEAARAFCREFADQNKTTVNFDAREIRDGLPSNISLSLFRILQEALQNSAKHSGVRQCDVRLWEADDAVHLIVRDRGAGFDVEMSKRSRGIGLISMRERVRLMNGTLSIEAQPRRGTTIHARLPLRASQSGARV
jgi:signal transduction histidine kinase